MLPAQVILANGYFVTLMISTIVLAGVMVGMQNYPSMSSSPVLAGLNFYIQIAFSVECVLKILREGPRPLRYW